MGGERCEGGRGPGLGQAAGLWRAKILFGRDGALKSIYQSKAAR